MDFSASAATKDAARIWRRRSCTPPRFSSTLPTEFGNLVKRLHANVNHTQSILGTSIAA
jgi:hypothetical protein